MRTQLMVTLDSAITMTQRTEFSMEYELDKKLATVSVRTNGLILSTEQGAALVAALDSDPRVAAYAPFVPPQIDLMTDDFGDILDEIGVVPTPDAQPSEWEFRGSRNGE